MMCRRAGMSTTMDKLTRRRFAVCRTVAAATSHRFANATPSRLTVSQVLLGLKALGVQASNEELAEYFDGIDKDGSGTLDVGEARKAFAVFKGDKAAGDKKREELKEELEEKKWAVKEARLALQQAEARAEMREAREAMKGQREARKAEGARLKEAAEKKKKSKEAMNESFVKRHMSRKKKKDMAMGVQFDVPAKADDLVC